MFAVKFNHGNMMKNTYTCSIFNFQVEFNYFSTIVNRKMLDGHKRRIKVV